VFNPALPALLIDQLWPMAADKTNLSPLRLINFLAIAIVIVRAIPVDSKLFGTRWAKPIIRCGQHSLHVFCLSILLSALGHFLLAELHGGVALQVAVNLAGCSAMVGTASLIAWYMNVNRSAEPAPTPPRAGAGACFPPGRASSRPRWPRRGGGRRAEPLILHRSLLARRSLASAARAPAM
jgi:hypothetical protein